MSKCMWRIQHTSSQSIREMIQYSGQSTPVHPLTELDHSGSETVTCLCQVLDYASWDIILASDGMDGDFVAEIAEL